jgi:hypothetical protein
MEYNTCLRCEASMVVKVYIAYVILVYDIVLFLRKFQSVG